MLEKEEDDFKREYEDRHQGYSDPDDGTSYLLLLVIFLCVMVMVL